MTHQANGFNATDISYIRHGTAAAENPFYQSTAAPDSLATLMRGHIIVRNCDAPITFPFAVEEVTGYYRRAG